MTMPSRGLWIASFWGGATFPRGFPWGRPDGFPWGRPRTVFLGDGQTAFLADGQTFSHGDGQTIWRQIAAWSGRVSVEAWAGHFHSRGDLLALPCLPNHTPTTPGFNRVESQAPARGQHRQSPLRPRSAGGRSHPDVGIAPAHCGVAGQDRFDHFGQELVDLLGSAGPRTGKAPRRHSDRPWQMPRRRPIVPGDRSVPPVP